MGEGLYKNFDVLAQKLGICMQQSNPPNNPKLKILPRNGNILLRRQKMDRKNLGRFFKMNKIVPGGLLKLQEQSVAIKKAKKCAKPNTKNLKVQSYRN